MAGGVVFLLLTFLNAVNTLCTLGLILLMVGLPTAYSYLYYRKHCKE